MATVPQAGLLEQSALRIASPDATGVVPLCDETQAVIGQAYWQPASWWRRWLWPVLFVHEVPEHPLVFLVQRRLCLPPRWLVCDAEGDTVGTLAGDWLLDRWDRPQVYHRSGANRRSGSFLDAVSGHYLASWQPTAEGYRLAFLAADEPDPFTRMLLLAAVLVRLDGSG